MPTLPDPVEKEDEHDKIVNRGVFRRLQLVGRWAMTKKTSNRYSPEVRARAGGADGAGARGRARVALGGAAQGCGDAEHRCKGCGGGGAIDRRQYRPRAADATGADQDRRRGRRAARPSVETRLGHAQHARHRGDRASRPGLRSGTGKPGREHHGLIAQTRPRLLRGSPARPATGEPRGGAAPTRRALRRQAGGGMPLRDVLPACRRVATHAQIDCAVGSNSRASSSGDRPARTRSTIWRRTQGYKGDGSWASGTSAKASEVSTKTGQSHLPSDPLQSPASQIAGRSRQKAALRRPPPNRAWRFGDTVRCLASDEDQRWTRERGRSPARR